MSDEHSLRGETAQAAETAAPHPEEMQAEARLRAGPFSVEARARATPAGLIATAVLLSAILIPIMFMRRRAEERP